MIGRTTRDQSINRKTFRELETSLSTQGSLFASAQFPRKRAYQAPLVRVITAPCGSQGRWRRRRLRGAPGASQHLSSLGRSGRCGRLRLPPATLRAPRTAFSAIAVQLRCACFCAPQGYDKFLSVEKYLDRNKCVPSPRASLASVRWPRADVPATPKRRLLINQINANHEKKTCAGRRTPLRASRPLAAGSPAGLRGAGAAPSSPRRPPSPAQAGGPHAERRAHPRTQRQHRQGKDDCAPLGILSCPVQPLTRPP